MVQVDEVECGCCYEMLVNPTTLTCGHSFCRYCLAKWSEMSKKTECPECRQKWTEFPQVNFHLRSIVEKSFPTQSNSRKESQMSMQDYQETMKIFEKRRKGGNDEQQIGNVDGQQINANIGMAVLAFGAALLLMSLILLYFIFFSGPRTSEVIYSKPVHKWTTTEVVEWVRGFTGQIEHDYSEGFEKAGINGRLLLSLTEDDLLSPPIDVPITLHRKILLDEIVRLNSTKIKQPGNLWEYKKAHQGNAVFLLLMLQDSPRLTFAYLHYMEYHTIFLPILRGVIGKEECDSTTDEDTMCSGMTEDITTTEKLRFYLKVFIFPYYFISQCAWRYLDIHYITTLTIISHCIMLTLTEIARLQRLPRFRYLPRAGFNCVFSFLVTCVWYWSLLFVTPAFILDIVFYGKLYYGPFDTANNIRRGNLRGNILAKLLDGLAATGHNIWRIVRVLINRRD